MRMLLLLMSIILLSYKTETRHLCTGDKIGLPDSVADGHFIISDMSVVVQSGEDVGLNFYYSGNINVYHIVGGDTLGKIIYEIDSCKNNR